MIEASMRFGADTSPRLNSRIRIYTYNIASCYFGKSVQTRYFGIGSVVLGKFAVCSNMSSSARIRHTNMEELPETRH